MTDVSETPALELRSQRLLLDVREVRDRTRLRLLAALPAFAGGLWLLWTGDSVLLRVLALSGLVFALAWVMLARRNIAQLGMSDSHYLDIAPDGLTIRSGAQSQTLAWSDIDAVEIDEDRLVVQLRTRATDSGSIAVEPQYGSLGLRELAETIDEARRSARPRAGMRSPQS